MKCEMCHKGDAKVAIRAAVGGKERELYVCKACAEAEKRRMRTPRHSFPNPFSDDDFFDSNDKLPWEDFPDYDDDDLPFPSDTPPEDKNRHWTLAENASPCPECGTTAEDIKNTGLLGCPHCYTVFKELLERNVRLRGTFGGKTPRRRSGTSNDLGDENSTKNGF